MLMAYIPEEKIVHISDEDPENGEGSDADREDAQGLPEVCQQN